MRNEFLKLLNEQLNQNRTWFLTGDVGFGYLDKIAVKLGGNFINVGIREPTMLSMATGIALSNSENRVFVFTMCAFYLRTIEQVRNDVLHHNVNVKMIGAGINKDYGFAGFSHWATQDSAIMDALGVPVLTVSNSKTAMEALASIRDYDGPMYIRLKK